MIIDNFKIDSFQLMAGAPILVPGTELIIHQPKLYQIATIGEEKFYEYLSFFKITKDIIINTVKSEEYKIELSFKSEYEVFKILLDNQEDIKMGVEKIFNLVIKDIEIIKFNDFFIFIKIKEGQQYIINNDSFLLIKEIICTIFDIKEKEKASVLDFNPSDSIASDIVEKLKKRKEALEKARSATTQDQGKKDQSILADFVSILAIGLSMSVKEILSLTLYQIFNLMKRFNLYTQYQLQIQAMLQGAENVEPVDWLQKI